MAGTAAVAEGKVILKKIKGEELPEDCGCPVHRAKLSDSLKSAGDLVAGKELLKSAGDFVAGIILNDI